jgi:hypothetical protein
MYASQSIKACMTQKIFNIKNVKSVDKRANVTQIILESCTMLTEHTKIDIDEVDIQASLTVKLCCATFGASASARHKPLALGMESNSKLNFSPTTSVKIVLD